MCGAIRHRGPDDSGYFVEDDVAIGMRRLSIIDVSGGAQPIANEDASLQVVFNGEIYNHRVLRAELEHRHALRSRSDTEVLVHLYEEHGVDMLRRLRGMFAFALWDSRRARLLVARDRLGIKPLYYWPTDGGVVFGSELRSFLCLPQFPRRVSRTSMTQYLGLGYVPDPHSIFEGVHKLPPGHFFTWSRTDGLRVEPYWTAYGAEAPISDPRAATEELKRLLDDAVSSHLESDVPLGAFLSGGIDSSTVVAHMVRQAGGPVRTFSIGFSDEAYNEAPHAARVAEALGTLHTELIVRPDADALVETVAQIYDEPFGDPSALPTMMVSRLARQHVTVALSGDGGDELFGGYSRYGELLGRRELRPAWLRSGLRAVVRRSPHGLPGRNRLLDLARTRRLRYGATVAYPISEVEGGVVRDADAETVGSVETLLEQWFDDANGRDFLTQMTLVDIASYLPGDILTKVDRASMSVSLEARVPLLDHPLVEFAVALPASMKRRNGTGKWLLREAVASILPPAVMQYPKRGFGVPLDAWFRQELGYRLDQLLRPDAEILAYADRDSIARLVREHRSRRRDHGYFLWRLLVADLWLGAMRRGDLAQSTEMQLSAEPVVTSAG